MSIPRSPDPARLVVGVYTPDQRLFNPVLEELKTLYGAVDSLSGWMTFDRTDYYEKEMGGPLYRRMTSFESLIGQDDLADIKLATNAIEARYAVDGKRTVNIDPGYMLLSRFILATGKEFSHRIYIGKGIYGDLTLIYSRQGFKTLPWTYPDYTEPEMMAYLLEVRNRYAADLKAMEHRKPHEVL